MQARRFPRTPEASWWFVNRGRACCVAFGVIPSVLSKPTGARSRGVISPATGCDRTRMVTSGSLDASMMFSTYQAIALAPRRLRVPWSAIPRWLKQRWWVGPMRSRDKLWLPLSPSRGARRPMPAFGKSSANMWARKLGRLPNRTTSALPMPFQRPAQVRSCDACSSKLPPATRRFRGIPVRWRTSV